MPSTVKSERLRAKIEEYTQSITIHGFTRILTAGRNESAVWLLLLFGSTCLISYVIHDRVMVFKAKEVHMDIKNEAVERNYFPAITICRNRVNTFRYCEGNRLYLIDDQITVTSISSVKNWHCYFMKVSCSIGINCKSLNLGRLSPDGNCATWNKRGAAFGVDGYNELTIKPNVKNTENGNLEIIIHHPDTFGQVQENTILMSAGYNYELMLEKKVIKRQKYPFKSNCIDKKHPDIFPGNYTRGGCLTSMKCIEGLKRCGDTYDICKVHIDMKLYGNYFNKTSPEQTVRECLTIEWQKSYFHACPPSCVETQYEVSSSIFSAIQDYGKSQIRFRIRYEDPYSYEIVEEKQLYDLRNLLCESGGFLGLLMGASIVSIVELIILLILKVIRKFS